MNIDNLYRYRYVHVFCDYGPFFSPRQGEKHAVACITATIEVCMVSTHTPWY